MPMEFGLELVAVVSSNLPNTERELFNDVINEVDRACLRMFLIDLKGTNSGRIINRGELEPAHFLAAFSLEGQKLDVHLDVMSWHLFLIALGVQFTHSCASGQAVEAIALEGKPLHPRF